MAALVKVGMVRQIRLSEVSAQTLRKACTVYLWRTRWLNWTNYFPAEKVVGARYPEAGMAGIE